MSIDISSTGNRRLPVLANLLSLQSGLGEIKVPGNTGERICRYPEESVPERYSGLPVAGLPTRVNGAGVHNAWAVVANVSDHRTMFALAALRRLERNRE